jgi:protein-tyrosine phosphatase
MIDIHHHLLFGLDDGAKDIETSVAMAEMAANDGITHIVCTPHANFQYPFDTDVNREKLDELRARIRDRVILGLGCDFHLSFENIDDALKNPAKYTINQKKYLLVEFADLAIPQQMTQVFYQFLVAGIQPIITHPERNLTILKFPQRLDEWLHGGCLVQVTASSLTGRFGRTSATFSHKLLEENKVHFLATDAHNLQSRPPRMKEAFDLLAKQYGLETAERLCVSNPRAAFFGEDLPPQPVAADGASTAQAGKRGFFSRLFGVS